VSRLFADTVQSPSENTPVVPELERRWQAFLDELDRRDGCARDHSAAVCTFAVQIGRALALAETELALIATGALMHDIGKVFIQGRVLAKPTPLSESEWWAIRLHPALGEAFLTPNEFEEVVLGIVRWHHERWDGGGYPDRLEGRSIPLGARIVAAADAFSAMRETRPYRSALHLEDAVEELERSSWSQLDGDCVRALVNSLN
jgi:HD-GYP domain-containing protein (c-di-GMP phosphodiesterase class II)